MSKPPTTGRGEREGATPERPAAVRAGLDFAARDGTRYAVPRDATAADVLALLREQRIRFLRLQFADVLGEAKAVEVPSRQFEKALDGEVTFDGSTIEGFVRVEESDMRLRPDPSTFAMDPWSDEDNRVARLICDIYQPDGSSFEGDPRRVLKRQIAQARELGYQMMAGIEAEFFLFQRDAQGAPTRATHDSGSYFDLTPVDLGDAARRDIVNALELLGFEVEAAHHEVAPGQHEIDFRYADALTTADQLLTFKYVVRNVAMRHGLHASFMPKPIFGVFGSGLHTHQSLFREGENAFFDPRGPDQMSDVMRWYVAGLLEHAREFCAVTNPLVNSYKRLVPGFEAPVNVAWSHRNRSPLVRVPARRGRATRLELRTPDPATNPYLSLTVQLASGLDGIREKLEPPDPVDKNIFALSVRDRRHYRVQELPRDLGEAIDLMKRSSFMRRVLGEHVFRHYVAAKEAEWQDYIVQVHDWEVRRYLST